jgi:hypothetical protein
MMMSFKIKYENVEPSAIKINDLPDGQPFICEGHAPGFVHVKALNEYVVRFDPDGQLFVHERSSYLVKRWLDMEVIIRDKAAPQ